MKKVLTILICFTLLGTSVPAQALRPVASSLSESHVAYDADATDAQIFFAQPTDKIPPSLDKKRHTARERIFLAASAALAVSSLVLCFSLFEGLDKREKAAQERARQEPQELLKQGSEDLPDYPSEEERLPPEQRIIGLNAAKLARKGFFIFGKDDCYRKAFFSETETLKLSPDERRLSRFAALCAVCEVRSLIYEALGEPGSTETGERGAVTLQAFRRKARQILCRKEAESIDTKIRKAANKEEALAIFLSIVENLTYAYGSIPLKQKELMKILEAGGISQLIDHVPEILLLTDILEIKFNEADSREERLRKIDDKLSRPNRALFMPHGFYASTYLFEGFCRKKWRHWLFRIRHKFKFEGEEALILQRHRDDTERFTTAGLQTRIPPREPALVFHEEAKDKEKLCLDAIYGRRRYSRQVSENAGVQKEFERQITLMFIKALSENTELGRQGAITSYKEFGTLLHELTHNIRGGRKSQLLPYLVELAYADPYIEAENLFFRLLRGADWIYAHIFAPIIGIDAVLPRNPEERTRNKLLAIARFRAMSRDKIQQRAKKLLYLLSPGIYEAFESAEGKRFGTEALNEIKAKNMAALGSLQSRQKHILGISRTAPVMAAATAIALLEGLAENPRMSRRRFFGLPKRSGKSSSAGIADADQPPPIKGFDQMLNFLKAQGGETVVVVPVADSASTLTAVNEFLGVLGDKAGAILVGDKKKILDIIRDKNLAAIKVDVNTTIDAEKNDISAIAIALHHIHSNRAHILLKGRAPSDVLLKAALASTEAAYAGEGGLRLPGELTSHLRVFETPHGMFAMTDGGINVKGGGHREEGIIHNAMQVMRLLGVQGPTVFSPGSSRDERTFEAAFGLKGSGEKAWPDIIKFPGIEAANIIYKACAKRPWRLTFEEEQVLSGLGRISIFRKDKTADGYLIIATPKAGADLRARKRFIEEAVRAAMLLGISQPKVALLDFTEQVHPFINVPTIHDAVALEEFFRQSKKCIVEGPMAYDIAVYPDAAKVKGFAPGGKPSKVGGAPDILFMPDSVSGELLETIYLNWDRLGLPWKAADISFGALAPILVPSRADEPGHKLRSIITAAYLLRRSDEADEPGAAEVSLPGPAALSVLKAA